MTLLRFEPVKEFESFAKSMQKMFEEFPTPLFGTSDSFSPRIDIYEDEKNVYIDAEIAGLGKEDIKVTLEDNILTLQGEKKIENEKKDKTCYRSERMYGSFKRSFTLPVQVDAEKVDAKFNNGLLKVKIEKLAEKPKNQKEITVN